jgi:hypothetical protein
LNLNLYLMSDKWSTKISRLSERSNVIMYQIAKIICVLIHTWFNIFYYLSAPSTLVFNAWEAREPGGGKPNKLRPYLYTWYALFLDCTTTFNISIAPSFFCWVNCTAISLSKEILDCWFL